MEVMIVVFISLLQPPSLMVLTPQDNIRTEQDMMSPHLIRSFKALNMNLFPPDGNHQERS